MLDIYSSSLISVNLNGCLVKVCPVCKDKVRTYLKNNLSAHGGVVERFKMYCPSRFQRDSAFSPFHAPDSRDFAKLNLLFLNPNLIFEIGSS